MPNNNPSTIRDWLNWGTSLLQPTSTSPNLDSEVLLAHTLNYPRLKLVTCAHKTLTHANVQDFKKVIKKRAHGIPIAYLIGTKDFYGRTFFVTPDTLIPRPDSECVIDFLKQKNDHTPLGLVIDIGTGTGCLAITIQKEIPTTSVYASDISPQALIIAKKNALEHDANICFFEGNLWSPFSKLQLPKSIDIIANLPYLPDATITGDLNHEPRLALAGGITGLDVYEKLFIQLAKIKDLKINLYCEIIPDQESILKKQAEIIFTTCVFHTIHDLNNKSRFIQISI